MRDDEYEVVIARHGTRRGLRSEAFLNYSSSGQPDGPIVTDYYLWVLRNSNRTIFVDSGFAASAAARRERAIVYPPVDLYRRLGVDTGAGWPVVITHAHWDHIGNLDLFPNSVFHISRAEADFWETPVSASPHIAHFTEPDELEALRRLRAENRLAFVAPGTELAPGVHVYQVGGHTPGQSMLTVRTPDGVVLLTSDVVHVREELADERPFIAVTDLPDMLEGYRLVKRLLAEGEVDLVVTGHDPAELEQGTRVDPNIAIIGLS